MNIGLITNSTEKQMTGIGRVTYDTLSELLSIDNENRYFLIDANGFHDLKIPSIYDNDWTLQGCLYEETLLPNLFLNKIDVLYSFFPAINVDFPCKKILTVHDVIPMIYPQWNTVYEYFDGPLRKSIVEADKIIAMSESTKRDIVKYYNVDEGKIEVIYSGIQPSIAKVDKFTNVDLKEMFGIKGRYIISVCTVEPRKNLQGLIEAFLDYKKKSNIDDIQLVLTGRIGWGTEIIDYVLKNDQNHEDIVFTDYVSSEILSILFKQATAVAYVSFYEGFGLPILEGMAAGKAVISSNTSSMPEVGGDAVEYCNPYDKNSIVSSISKVLENDDYRELLEKKAKIRAELFSYKKTARQVYELLQEVVQC